MEGIGDEIYDLGIAELGKREGEVRAFERSVKVAQKAAQDKGIAEVRRHVWHANTLVDNDFLCL